MIFCIYQIISLLFGPDSVTLLVSLGVDKHRLPISLQWWIPSNTVDRGTTGGSGKTTQPSASDEVGPSSAFSVKHKDIIHQEAVLTTNEREFE